MKTYRVMLIEVVSRDIECLVSAENESDARAQALEGYGDEQMVPYSDSVQDRSIWSVEEVEEPAK
jgi:hypothetical protein